MELDREQIKKELVLFIDDMPVELHLGIVQTSKFSSFLRLVLDVITTDDQKIFELENRLKECENGYEGTLYLDRCKLHDAEEKLKELTEENEGLRGIIEQCSKNNTETLECLKELKKEIEEYIKNVNEAVRCAVRFETLYKIKCKQLETVEAVTVRKMHSNLYEEFLKVARTQEADEPNMRSQEVIAILEQKTKEMLEGKNENNS